MVRKLAAALLGVGVMVPGLVQALGLGNIKLHSALSEPLNAEIELVQVRELTADEILPSLASNADFQSKGVERFHYLSDMKFEVVVNQGGRSFIKVTSRKPMVEPGLDFLVEVHWPDGRLVREYSLLLDPPLYRPQAAPQIRSATSSASPTLPKSSITPTTPRNVSPSPATTTPRATSSVASDATSAPSAPAGGDSYGPTGPSDNLWAIASQLRPSNRVNVHQTMLAIQRLNPQAFLNGNINLLKRGQVLRAPSEADAMSVGGQEAIQMVAEQNRAWREKTPTPQTAQAAPVDATGKGAGTVPTRSEGDDGKLTLVAPAKTEAAADKTAQGGTSSSTGGVMREKLAMAEENTDKFKLENEDLKLKVNDLQEQADTTNQVLKLKNDQIAALQAQMADLQSQLQAAKTGKPAAESTSTPQSATAPASSVTSESVPVTTPAATAEKAVATEPAPASEVDYNYEKKEEKPAAAIEPAKPEATKPETSESVSKSESEAGGGVVSEIQKPQLVTQEAPKPEKVAPKPTLAEEILSNWFYLLGIAGLGALGFVGAALSKRKKEAASEIDDALVKDFSLPTATPSVSDQRVAAASAEVEIPAVEPTKDETVAQTADVVGEADIYIAYGRFNQAVEMLEKAASKDPGREDIRLKLLEVAVESKNPELFEKHASNIRAVGNASSIARMDALFRKLPTDSDATLVAPAPAQNAVEAPDNENIELQDLDFDAGEIDFSADNKPAGTVAKPEPVGGLDFNLDFRITDTPVPPKAAPAPTPAPVADNSLDFDLEIDLEKEFAPAAKAPAPQPEDELPDLEFESDFNIETDDVVVSKKQDSGLDENLDIELETTGLAAADADEETPLEFELVEDLDTSSRPEALTDEDDVRHAMDFENEDTIDSSSAAMLADELDFEAPAKAVAESSAEGFSLDEAALDNALHEDELSLDDDITLELPVPPTPAARTTESDLSDEDLNFITDGDEASTKLDLARAYIDMGDRDGAKDILDEVLQEGNADQQREAKELLARLE